MPKTVAQIFHKCNNLKSLVDSTEPGVPGFRQRIDAWLNHPKNEEFSKWELPSNARAEDAVLKLCMYMFQQQDLEPIEEALLEILRNEKKRNNMVHYDQLEKSVRKGLLKTVNQASAAAIGLFASKAEKPPFILEGSGWYRFVRVTRAEKDDGWIMSSTTPEGDIAELTIYDDNEISFFGWGNDSCLTRINKGRAKDLWEKLDKYTRVMHYFRSKEIFPYFGYEEKEVPLNASASAHHSSP